MANYLPTNRIPVVNVYQEIANARGRELNEETDIIFPPYIVDRRVLRCLEYGNLEYFKSYLRQCPRNIERYFYLETVTSVNPVLRSIIVANLFGYALLYRSTQCIDHLLKMGANPFQAAYFIEWASYSETQRKLLLYEAPAIILLSGSLQPDYKPVAIEIMASLRASELELHTPISLRRQQLEPQNEPVSVTIRFADTWECLEKELEKKGGPNMAKNKTVLKELKAVYRANKFDKLRVG